MPLSIPHFMALFPKGPSPALTLRVDRSNADMEFELSPAISDQGPSREAVYEVLSLSKPIKAPATNALGEVNKKAYQLDSDNTGILAYHWPARAPKFKAIMPFANTVT